jgi:hypothetical protein
VGLAREAYVVSPGFPSLAIEKETGCRWVTTSNPITCLFRPVYLFWTVSKNFV